MFIKPALAAESLNQYYLKGSTLTGKGADLSVSQFLQPIIINLPYVTGVLALLTILFAGFRYISSAGNADETQKAANMLTYALVGLALSVLAFFLTRVIFSLLGLGSFFS